MSDLPLYLETLSAQAQPDGGWSYRPDQPADLEPTCLALLALALDRDPHAAAIDRGLAALRACRAADGSYRLPRGRPQAVWPTALALFALAALDQPAAEVAATADFLLRTRGRYVPADPELATTTDIDTRAVGWPWAEGNFAWAEPTAWACLALRRAGRGDHPRVAEGLRLLLDRAFDQGGINYGNRRVLGTLTEPMPGPSALMLLALQRTPDHPRVAAAFGYLLGEAERRPDLEHLAWTKLAFDPYADRAEVAAALPTLDACIRTAHAGHAERHGFAPPPLRQALTALALAPVDRPHPFRLAISATPANAPLEGPAGPSAESAEPRLPLGERIKSSFRGFFVEGFGRLRPPPPNSAVHIAKADDYNADLVGVLARQYEAFRATVPLAGKRVVLKPNLVEYNRAKVINTDPRVVGAVIELCQREGAAEVIVAEGPGHYRNVAHLVAESGLGEVLRHYGVGFVDLNHDEPVKTLNLGRLTGLDHLYLARTVVLAEVLISLPKLKTHHWAGATLSLKNLFGTLPGVCYGWPKNELHWRGIPNSIIDIALTLTPHLAIVDGIVGMEGDGPINGVAKPMGVLVMGADLLAVDATCCRLMGLVPERLPQLVLGAQKRLGQLAAAQIPLIGERIEGRARPFALPPQIEKLLLARPA